MPVADFEIAVLASGYAIDVKWLDGSVERAPGLFNSQHAAEDCVSSEGFISWLQERARIRAEANERAKTKHNRKQL